MARKSTCPPGVWCLTPTLGIFLCVGILIALYFLTQTMRIPNQPSQQPIHVFNSVAASEGGDDRYTRAPEPLRVWQTGPDLRGALLPPGATPINVATRGVPQTYQQMGILKSGDNQVLPLYGRQTAYRTDRYNYYTRTDTYNPVQLPIKYERRDCMDTNGCGELLGGESVKIGGIGKDASVEIYKFDGPTYIPGIV